jgi:hypothetical protein
MCYHCLRCFSFSITIIKYFWLWAISFLSTSLHAPLYRTPPLCTPSPSTEHPIMYTLTLYRTPHYVHPHSLQNTPLCTPSPSVMLTYAHDERQAITWQKVGHFTYICHNIVVFFTRKCAFWFLSIIKHILKTHQSKTRLRWRLELFILNSNIVILLIYLIVYISNIPI